MEENKTYPSLPSNYVTFAQLRERWLKKQKQINQPQPQQQQQQQQHQEQEQKQNQRQQLPLPNHHHQPPRSGTVSPKQYRLKNRTDLQTHSRETEAASDDRRKSEAGDAIGDEDADLDGTVSESKKKWVKKKNKKRKPKVKESGASEGAAAQGKEDAEETTIESELNGKKKDSSITVEEVEQKVRILSMNSGNGEQSGRLRKMNNGFRYSQSQRNYYGYRYANGQKDGVRRRDKMVWVRKDGNVGEIET